MSRLQDPAGTHREYEGWIQIPPGRRAEATERRGRSRGRPGRVPDQAPSPAPRAERAMFLSGGAATAPHPGTPQRRRCGEGRAPNVTAAAARRVYRPRPTGRLAWGSSGAWAWVWAFAKAPCGHDPGSSWSTSMMPPCRARTLPHASCAGFSQGCRHEHLRLCFLPLTTTGRVYGMESRSALEHPPVLRARAEPGGSHPVALRLPCGKQIYAPRRRPLPPCAKRVAAREG